jgi:hypothetical protein
VPTGKKNESTGGSWARSRARQQKKPRYIPRGGEAHLVKPYKSLITEIAQDTFNSCHSKFAKQLMELRKNIANHLQHFSVGEGYLVAAMV